MTNREKTGATKKATRNDRGRKRATAAKKLVIALELEAVDAKAAHDRLIVVSARYEADATRA